MLRRLLYVIPAAAALVAGYALLGPARDRSVTAARLLAAPDADGKISSLRVVAARREEQRDFPLEGEIVVSAAGRSMRAKLDGAGVAEVRFAEPLFFGDDVRIGAGERTLLAAKLAAPDGMPEPIGFALYASGHHEGALHVSAHLRRGPLVPPFADVVAFEIEDAKDAPVDAISDVKFDGATCAACDRPTPSESRFELEVVPIADTIEVNATAKTLDGRTGSFSGKLPTAMGSLWLARDSSPGKLSIMAANPKNAAYVSFFEGATRVGGATVRLADRGDGFYAGTLDVEPDLAAASVVLSTDEREAGRTATAWRLAGEGATPERLPRLEKVADGFPDAMRAERTRLRTMHLILAGFIASLAVLEIVLLAALARASRRDLTEHFRETLDGADEAAPPIQPVRSTLVVVLVVAALLLLSAAAVIALTIVAH